MNTMPAQTTLQQGAKRLLVGLVLAAAVTLLHQDAAAQTAPVNLGTASNFGVLAGPAPGGAITNTGPTTITGDVGGPPAGSITGFGSVTLTGTNHADDAVAQQAQLDLITAYNDAAGRPGTVVAADLVGLNLVSGVYTNPAMGLTGVLTLNAQGNPDAVWIFQSGSSLIIANDSSVVLINGGQACHVFWQVTSSATLGTNADFQGNILALTSITANTGATVVGRLLARNGAVTLDTNTIAVAICAAAVAATTTDDEAIAASAAELAAALILAAKLVDIASLPGLTSIYTQGFAQFDTEVFSLQQRLADIRAGSGDAGVPDVYNPIPHPVSSEKNPWSGKNVRGGKNAWGGEGVQPKEVQLADDDRWGFFITGTGDFASAGDINGYDGTTVGTTLGVDCRLSEHWVVGVSIGYSHSESDLFDGSEVESDGGKVALYAMYQHGGFFVEGLIGGGYNNYETTRTAFLGNARGSTHGLQFDSYLGMGYDLRMGGWTVTPMVSLLYTRVGIDGYDEVGSLVPLNIESQHASSLRIRLGPRVAYTTHWGAARVTPSFSAQWQHEFLDDELPFSARFADDPSSLFTVRGPKIGRDSLLLTAGLNVAWKRYAAYLAYQADLGRKNYESHTALAGFRVSW